MIQEGDEPYHEDKQCRLEEYGKEDFSDSFELPSLCSFKFTFSIPSVALGDSSSRSFVGYDPLLSEEGTERCEQRQGQAD